MWWGLLLLFTALALLPHALGQQAVQFLPSGELAGSAGVARRCCCTKGHQHVFWQPQAPPPEQPVFEHTNNAASRGRPLLQQMLMPMLLFLVQA